MTQQERQTLERLARRANDAERRVGIAIGNRSFDPHRRTPAQAIGVGWVVLFRLFISGLTDERGRRRYRPRREDRRPRGGSNAAVESVA